VCLITRNELLECFVYVGEVLSRRFEEEYVVLLCEVCRLIRRYCSRALQIQLQHRCVTKGISLIAFQISHLVSNQ